MIPSLARGASTADTRRSARLPSALVVALGVVTLTAGCAASVPVSISVTGSRPVATEPPRATTPPAPAIDAVLAALKAAGAKDPDITAAGTDPNDLLGRPGQYGARATFVLTGGKTNVARNSSDRGGSVEIWPDIATAQTRVESLQRQIKANPALGVEYDYLAGSVLVRVTGRVKPADAKKIEDAVKGLPR